MIALLGTAAVILLPVCYYFLLFIIKRKTMRCSSNEDNRGEGNDQTSSTDASVPGLPHGETYEVFLNFSGEDTRKGFTDHLYQSLVNVRVSVFRDNEALGVGERIGPELDKAIKASKISIPIISPNYASSKWCLWELVHILKCKETKGQVVLPIFYRVDPSSIRNQTGTFEEAFRLHEKKYGSCSKVVQEWRDALAKVADLKGWESSKTANGHEGELVKIVVAEVLNGLKKPTLDEPEYLVGVKDHLDNILKMIEGKESSDTKAIVIHGMGGVGKTTLAKILFNQLSSSFKHCSFLPNIRENRPKDLQKQLISDILGRQWQGEISHEDEGVNIIKDSFKEKKVLILFDDVCSGHDLYKLARKPSWFKSGSILIITSRNKDVLNTWEREERLTYKLNELDSSLSFELFIKRAFRSGECPSKKFHAIAKDIVSTTGGLPLAIEIIGSMLRGKSIDYWNGTFEKLQEIPHPNVQEMLKISYDVLDLSQKQIFLDIACLPIHDKINFAFYMWDDCKFFPREGLEKLESLSLIKRGEGDQLTIHDQLRDLGRAIVREEGMDHVEHGNRSRLWDEHDAIHVMSWNRGTAKIQALNLEIFQPECLTSDQFKELTSLRFLRLKYLNPVGDFKNLLVDLRWLQLEGHRQFCLPTNFQPTKLVVLELSCIEFPMQGEAWAQIELAKKLKVLILEHCWGMTTTPDFFAFKQQAILRFQDCDLRRICPSICNLKKTLLTLDIRNCYELKELPVEMGEMEELRQLIVDGTSIESIPISDGFMTKLEKLSASGCSKLWHLPKSIGSLVTLVTLSLDSCQSLTMLPETIGNLKSLTELKLGGSKVMELPNSIGDLHNLKVLDISKTSIKRLPNTIGRLRNLRRFIANYLDKLTEVPDEIGELGSLQSLSFRECPMLSRLLACIPYLSSLQTLDLSGCVEPESMPNVPYSSTSLEFSSESMEMIQNVTNLSNLKDPTYYNKSGRHNRLLNFSSLSNLEYLSLSGIGYPFSNFENVELILELPSSLKELHLSNCPAFRALPSLSNLNLLSTLEIVRCGNLSKLSWMDDSTTYSELKYSNALESLPHLPRVRNLKSLVVWDCMNLMEIQGLASVDCLKKLEVGLCPSLERLDGMKEQKSLKKLRVVGCNPKIRSLDLAKLKYLTFLEINRFELLTEITRLQKMEYLKRLKISCCNSLDKLPDISLFTSLEELYINGCEILKEIKGFQGKLRILDLSNCTSLETLPDLSLCTNLKCLIVKGCEKLNEIKGLPESLRVLDVSRCKLMENLPDFSQCPWLGGLLAQGCNKLTEMMRLRRLEELKILDVSSCKSSETLLDFSLLRELRHLDLNGYEKLIEIKGLPVFLNILNISGCKSLANLPDFSRCRYLKGLLAKGCGKLTNIMGLLQLSKLEILDLSSCKSLESLPDISQSQNLKHVNLNGCKKLTEIKGLPICLKTLDISGCKLLAHLPDLSQCYSLEGLLAEGCSELVEFRGLENLQEIRVLGIYGCESLRRKPKLLKDCIRTDPLRKAGENITLMGKMTPIIFDEKGRLLEYHVSIIGSTAFQFGGSEPQTLLSCAINMEHLGPCKPSPPGPFQVLQPYCLPINYFAEPQVNGISLPLDHVNTVTLRQGGR